MRPSSVMVFAAGFGTRMGALTRSMPKPMIPVGGKPLIDHALHLVEGLEFDPIVVNLHYLPEQIRDHLNGRNILFADETQEILETGGGLKAALPLLGAGPVLTMNTDAAWAGPNPVPLLTQAWDPSKMDALLMCVPPENAIGHAGQGDFLLKDDRLSRGPGLVYSGVQIIKTDLLHQIPERAFSLNLLWNQMLAEGRIFGLSYPGKWCDVGRPEGISLAEDMLGAADV
ncbi:nucleotidyltransferase family protein [Thalassovita sp.]|uniref:nucleotidyltransferase family protein n=1 Tax=Thalassovita sp. TaxID=1979401 RepID=UPI003B5D03E8